ncbi:MAG: iron-containing alcohol dehydrogenase [Candidatus Hodarchaeota archaeon]
MQFDFLPIPRIYFGLHKFQDIGSFILEFGSRVFLVASESALKSNAELKKILNDSTSELGYEISTYFIKGEPTIEIIDSGVEEAKGFNSDVILGLGGGSVLDSSKAIAALVTNGGSALDYMEVIGKGILISKPPLPIIVAPTTAGTGSEVTKNTVIFAKDDKLKASIRSLLLIPKIAIIDPNLMLSLPPNVTATCGMDALTQLIESYTSNKSHPITDTLAILGIQRVLKSLPIAYQNGQSYEAREDMALAALLSGICLANVGLGAVHGFASPMGGLNIPHGVICSALLAPTIEVNIKELQNKSPNSSILVKYSNIGRLISGKSSSTQVEDHEVLIEYLRKLTQDLKIPSLSKYGMIESDIPLIVEKAKQASSMRYNPITLSDSALTSILEQVIG